MTKVKVRVRLEGVILNGKSSFHIVNDIIPDTKFMFHVRKYKKRGIKFSREKKVSAKK